MVSGFFRLLERKTGILLGSSKALRDLTRAVNAGDVKTAVELLGPKGHLANGKRMADWPGYDALINSWSWWGSDADRAIPDQKLLMMMAVWKEAGYPINEGHYVSLTGGPLCFALTRQLNWAAAWLLKNGANPNGPESSSRTPLQVALGNGRWEQAEMLLKAGADPTLGVKEKEFLRCAGNAATWARAAEEETPMGAVAKSGKKECIERFLRFDWGAWESCKDAEAAKADRLMEESGWFGQDNNAADKKALWEAVRGEWSLDRTLPGGQTREELFAARL